MIHQRLLSDGKYWELLLATDLNFINILRSLPFQFINRKRKLYRSYVSMSASKRADLIKTKAQMEQKSEALREQISFEERALEMIARSSNPQQLVKSVWYDNIFYTLVIFNRYTH